MSVRFVDGRGAGGTVRLSPSGHTPRRGPPVRLPKLGGDSGSGMSFSLDGGGWGQSGATTDRTARFAHLARGRLDVNAARLAAADAKAEEDYLAGKLSEAKKEKGPRIPKQTLAQRQNKAAPGLKDLGRSMYSTRRSFI
eukprot:COSAG04_NODE_999_length_8849_cov_3.214286_2_plen_139_part_00